MTNEDLVTFILVLRYSGLRIGDALMLASDRIDGDKLSLYTQKRGQHVYVSLPAYLVERLKYICLRARTGTIPPGRVRFEWTALPIGGVASWRGLSKLQSAIVDLRAAQSEVPIPII